jgi:hypothetical protein
MAEVEVRQSSSKPLKSPAGPAHPVSAPDGATAWRVAQR